MERRRQEEGLTLDRHLAFLHRLQERRLGLRRGAVDLVGQQQAREQGSAPELELRRLLVVDERAGQVGGQQVRGELGAREVEPESLRETPGRQGLAESREVLEQHMSLGEDRGEDELERLMLTHHGFLHLGEHARGELPRRAHRQLFAHSASILVR
jgi:hypothetical protein